MEGDFRVAGWLVQPNLNVVVAPDGTVCHVEPRVMEVLQFLARHPGEVHSREQIIQAVWKDAFVSDDALSRCILELRRVFGDQSREAHLIRTIPKRGYCLVAPVSALHAPSERYQTLRSLGENQLSRVFLARDSELRRMVVLKFLAPEQSTDDKSRKRLIHEARAAAGLDHPFICKIYDWGTLHGEPYVAMEYVEGETLKQRLAVRPLAIEEALKIASEIAEALEAAHARGIIHRDIKPSNIMLAKQGHVKVLDFGVAKRLAPAGGEDPDSTITRDGDDSKAGTIPYMSPEQLRGQAVQTTSDVFSFGLVLFEMVAGTHPFHRESPIDTAASILNDAPPPLPAADTIAPPLLRHIVLKALAKDPSQRYQVIQDARTDIQVLLDELGASANGGNGNRSAAAGEVGSTEDRAYDRKRQFPVLQTAALLAFAAALIAFISWLRRPATETVQPMLRAVIPISPAERLAGWNAGLEWSMASGRPTRAAMDISPDGRRLVFCGATDKGTRLYYRLLESDEVEPIPGTEGGTAPFFSPDGRRLGFWIGGSLRVADAAGGHSIEVCATRDAESPPCGADWLSSGEIVFALPHGPIRKVSASGSTPSNLTRLEAGEASHRLPHLLPGGGSLLFTSLACLEQCEPQVVAYSIVSGERRTVVRNGADARYIDGGFLVFARKGKLLAARFDPASLALMSEPVPILESVAHASGSWGDFNSLAAQFAISKDGHLAYAPGGEYPGGRLHLAIIDRDGGLTRIPIDTTSIFRPRFSPDGRRIAIVSRARIWITDASGSPLKEITHDRKTSRVIWSIGGDSLTFDYALDDGSTQIREMALATGSVRILVENDGRQMPGSWHPGGRFLAFVKHGPPAASDWTQSSQSDIWFFDRIEGRGKPFVESPHRESSPEFSPDGRWLAYVSTGSGEPEVMVAPFPPAGAQPVKASSRGGQEPLWAPNGRQLLWRYLSGSVWAADVSTAPGFKAGEARKLLEGGWRFRVEPWTRGFDISSDGRRFVTVEAETPPAPLKEITIVANWFAELRRTAGN